MKNLTERFMTSVNAANRNLTLATKIICTFVLLIMVGLLIYLYSGSRPHPSDSSIERVNRLLDSVPAFDSAKEARIDNLRRTLSYSSAGQSRYGALRQLFEEYSSYRCDSALHYINLCIDEARAHGLRETEIECTLQKTDILSRAGLFDGAQKTLASVPRADIPKALLPLYYEVNSHLYQYMYESTENTEFASLFVARRNAYNDSVVMTGPASGFTYAITHVSSLVEAKKPAEAIRELDELSGKYAEGTRERSIVEAVKGYAYAVAGDTLMQQRSLAASAASDLKASVKENLSLRQLAEVLYAEGDVDNADIYLKKSVEDANFFSARMRNSQSSQMLPLIDRTHQQLQRESHLRLQTTLWACIALAVCLLALAGVALAQNRALTTRNSQLQAAHRLLDQRGRELEAKNDALAQINISLRESNDIKEEYLGRFIDMSSSYINILEKYRVSLRKAVSQHNISAIEKQVTSNDVVNSALRELHYTFDSAFLRIFPDFPTRFNELVGETPEPQEGAQTEMLTPTQRIYALMRLGISDTAKVAMFLRCSVATVYSYKSRAKNKSPHRDDFEARVMSIGTGE